MMDNVCKTGFAIFDKLSGNSEQQSRSNLLSSAPNLEKLCYGYAYGLILGDDTLSLEVREKITLVALTMIGGMRGPLNFHINGCLNIGISPEDIIATIWSIDNYAPVINIQFAFVVIAEVFDERNLSLSQLNGEINPNLDAQYLASLDKKWKSAFLKILFENDDIVAGEKIINALSALAFHKSGSDKFIEQLQLASNIGLTEKEIIALFEHVSIYYGMPLAITALSEYTEFQKIKKAA